MGQAGCAESPRPKKGRAVMSGVSSGCDGIREGSVSTVGGIEFLFLFFGGRGGGGEDLSAFFPILVPHTLHYLSNTWAACKCIPEGGQSFSGLFLSPDALSPLILNLIA